VIDEVAETLRERERLASELRASTAQARVSAIVVASLPVVFLLLMSAGARDQASLLFGEPIGWLLLGVGGGLEGAGILWIRRLTRPRRFG
jgi:tight adherence protein B